MNTYIIYVKDREAPIAVLAMSFTYDKDEARFYDEQDNITAIFRDIIGVYREGTVGDAVPEE